MTTMKKRKSQSGFSLVELLVVIAILSIIMGSIFEQMNIAQQRSSAEQVKTDMMQESREFVDQMTRDLRDAGYPNRRNFAPDQLSVGNTIPDVQSKDAAAGVVQVDTNKIRFEGAVDGTGTVSSIYYYVDDDCPNPPCLKRSQKNKDQGDPVAQGTNPYVEVQNVVNDVATEPIFSAFDVFGNPITLPVDISNGDATASIGTIKIYLKVQSPYQDPRTHQKPIMTFVSTVRLPNCSMAYSSQGQSCN
jgi:prepilin-type N-terminal cleavage/methylation domain-containing protein